MNAKLKSLSGSIPLPNETGPAVDTIEVAEDLCRPPGRQGTETHVLNELLLVRLSNWS